MHFEDYLHKYIIVETDSGSQMEGVLIGIYDDRPRSDLRFLIFDHLGSVRCSAIVRVIVRDKNANVS